MRGYYKDTELSSVIPGLQQGYSWNCCFGVLALPHQFLSLLLIIPHNCVSQFLKIKQSLQTVPGQGCFSSTVFPLLYAYPFLRNTLSWPSLSVIPYNVGLLGILNLILSD